MENVTFWDLLTLLWNNAVGFLTECRINAFGIDFTLWEFGFGIAVVSLLLYAIFRVLN